MVFKVLFGFLEASCSSKPQVIAAIVVQSLPAGQQRTVVFAARATQVEVLGQQKLAGSDACGHFEKLAGQLSCCRAKRWERAVVVLLR